MDLFRNITLYDWVPLFKRVCVEISAIGKNPETRTQLLKQKSLEIFGANQKINQFENIDPLSFIYVLASKNTVNFKTDIFNKVISSFKLDVNFPTDWTFPTPQPNSKLLFFHGGEYINNEGTIIDSDVLWRLFITATESGIIDALDFKQVLSIKNV